MNNIKWIMCSDRLPPITTTPVLVTVPEHYEDGEKILRHIQVACYHSFTNSKGTHWFSCDGAIIGIGSPLAIEPVAWAFLPEPFEK